MATYRGRRRFRYLASRPGSPVQVHVLPRIWRKAVRAQQQLIAISVTALGMAGIALGVYAQKTFERRSYLTFATGGACQMATPRSVTVTKPPPLRGFTFQGVGFQYARGDVDCTTVKPGRINDNEERPACSFDHPYFLRVTAGNKSASYSIPFGGASVIVKGSSPSCSWRKS